MNFAVLPPELTSARIFAGAGPRSWLSVAASWDGLAVELDAAARSFTAVTSGLADGWRGPAMLAMTRAAAPYATWLTSAATQAERTAAQARVAAGAFETAQAAVVHPGLVAANRSGLVSLVTTNLFGQNAPAIAAAEAAYEQMWAQDVAAMAGYHAQVSAVAQQLSATHAATGLPGLSIDWADGTFNLGSGNQGANNIGFGNVGNGNIGVGNRGEGNIGVNNKGNCNVGLINIGNHLVGYGLPGDGNVGVNLIELTPAGGGSSTTTALLMGGTGPNPLPWSGFEVLPSSFITPTHPSYDAQFLVTPQKMFPITGPTSLTFDASIAEGMHRLNTATMNLHAAGKDIVVFGVSQSATVATLEMRYLQSLPPALRPAADELSFVLIANPNRPDGGLLSRFTGLSIPFLGFTFNGATPANVYPTVDYAIQYDGAADFPRYPLNLLATANALAGFAYIHPSYSLSAAQFASGIVQPVSPGSLTTYILIPTHDLPLLNPVRAIPLVGNPLADLVQPDLRVLVELGYDRTAYQDVPTPFGLFPQVDPAVLAAQLQQGAVQGIHDALGGLGFPGRLP
ncbi:PE-PPE domain-containing protein [Mycobacterium camsae]|uniref:PE-PPE domain-containing protein n=1 Tax=Mycobacterium gordonae TaxID=1778 RepID=UPI00197F8B7B|nr:PE-PPE domain-containing protein [Mycobacterium gordonae]